MILALIFNKRYKGRSRIFSRGEGTDVQKNSKISVNFFRDEIDF